MNSISANLNIMIKACEKASKILIRDFGEIEKLQVKKKGPSDFVTNADLRAEKIIIDELKKAKPNFSILSEEAGFKKNKEYPPILQNNSLKKKHSYKDNGKIISLKSIKVEHGNIDSICYVINNKLAYASDVSKIHKKDLKSLNNLKYLVIDCLQYNYHPSHYCLTDILLLIKKIKPKKTILTNLASSIDYNPVSYTHLTLPTKA